MMIMMILRLSESLAIITVTRCLGARAGTHGPPGPPGKVTSHGFPSRWPLGPGPTTGMALTTGAAAAAEPPQRKPPAAGGPQPGRSSAWPPPPHSSSPQANKASRPRAAAQGSDKSRDRLGVAATSLATRTRTPSQPESQPVGVTGS